MAGSSATATPPRRPHDLPTVPATRLSASSSVASSHSAQHLSLDAMLSAHGEAENPAMAALEQCISERNLLLSQNTQLWKLVEKSRGLYNESQKNLERVRTERDAYKAMLLQLGENPDAIARNHRVKEKQLKPSASSNGMRQAPESSTPARPTRHTSADNGTTLAPDWLPATFRTPPTVTVSQPSFNSLDASVTPALSAHQSPSTRPLQIPTRTSTDPGSSTLPASHSASPVTGYPPNGTYLSGSSAPSPIETTASSSQSGNQSVIQSQTTFESRSIPPDDPKQQKSSPVDSLADSSRAAELGQGHSWGPSLALSNAHEVQDARDSTTDKSSTRRDLSDGEFLDLEDEDSQYDSAADNSLTSPSPPDGRNPPDDTHGPRVPMQPPAADDFPLPPGTVNQSNLNDGESHLGTPQAIPAAERARKVDRDESPTTPTPNAYGPHSPFLPTYQSIIPEQEATPFRALPLLPYNLPYTHVTVTTSSIRPNDRGKDVLSFVIQVNPGNQKEPYMIEKLYSDVLGLDQRIRSRYAKNTVKKIPHLPDGKLWKDHAPSKVDQRKAVLEKYIQALINLPVKNNDEIIAFLTSDVIKETNKPVAREGYKEGYLTKRGKNFGGWKTRFFVLQGPQLEYYESRGGQHLGSIPITGAQIGRQHRSSDRRESEEEGEYRHAILIIEPKKATGGLHRHVLCAESDEERDSWVEILVRYVSGTYDERASPQSTLSHNTLPAYSSQPRSSTSSNAPADLPPNRDRRQPQKGMSKDDINISFAVPLSRLTPDASNAKLFQTTPLYDEPSGSSSKNTSNPSSSGQLTTVFTDAQTAKYLLDKGQSPSGLGTESQLSSSLPTSSPLDTAGGEFVAPVGPRANSELGHYPDLNQPQGSHGGGRNPQPSPERPRQRQVQRTSLHPVFEPSRSSETPSLGDRPASPEGAHQGVSRTDMPAKVKISGPMNGTPIPVGHKFGGKESTSEATQGDRRDKVKSRMFQWSWRQAEKSINPTHAHRAVFGVTLEESLDVAEIAGLPAVVFRCIDYLESMKADQEEGIYRLSGSSAVIKNLKDKFNSEGDVDLLRSDEYWDPHAIAGLLKGFFRDLPFSILTRDLHMRFLSVIDLVDPQERITELSHLIAILPLANYSLLRALTAHLISIVQNANVNKMTMRNVGIVFSPTLGIPAGVFSLMLAEFNRVFNVDGDAIPSESAVNEKVPPSDESGGDEIGHRNSKHYLDATTDELLGLSGRKLTGPNEEAPSDDGEEMSENTESGADTTDHDMTVESVPGNQRSTHQAQSSQELTPSRSRASTLAAARGLGIHVTTNTDASRHDRSSGLPTSPRPRARSPGRTHPQEGGTSGSSAPSQQQR